MIEEELRELGFSDNEVKVYLALLRTGRSKAGAVAHSCGIERSSTYDALKRLYEKGMISYVIEANTKVYAAAPPEKIVDVFEEKQERARILIPKLRDLKEVNHVKENIQKFRGYAGIKTVLNNMLQTLNEGDEHFIIGSEGQLTQRMPSFARIFVARKDKKKLQAKVLLRRGRHSEVRSEYARVRYLPQETESKSVTNIFGDKVIIILWSQTPEAIMIHDTSTAETYKAYFEFMWQHAEQS